MAQGNQGNQGNVGTANETWTKAGADAGYAIHNGLPHIGVSGDEGDGFIVPLSAPDWFHNVPEDARPNVFRAMASHALRVGQAKVKQAETPTRSTAIDAANSALNGGYKPTRERGNDIVESEAARMFGDHVSKLVLAAKPDATSAMIDATVATQADTDKGKALIAKFRGEIVERGTYAVSRKGKGKAGAVTVEL